MGISGVDNVIFTNAPSQYVIVPFVDFMKQKWPSLQIDVESIQADEEWANVPLVGSWYGPFSTHTHVIVYCYRDSEMRSFLEDQGYAPDGNKEGPLAIHLRRRQNLILQCTGIAETRTNSDLVQPPRPYQGWFCTPSILEVTLVTPDSPEQNAFSRSVLGSLLHFCKG